MKLLFDFDGVLMDSCDETALTSYRALTGDKVTKLEELSPDVLNLYRKNRHHSLPAGETFPLMRWCISTAEGGSSIAEMTREEWEVARDSEEKPLKERTKLFFAARQEIIDADRAGWLPLSKPYQPIWDELKKIAEKVMILTNKNRSAVMELCEFWGLEVKEPHIFSGDEGTTKMENLAKIFTIYNDKQWVFIDDQLDNLLKVKNFVESLKDRPADFSFGYRVAGWGYVSEESLRSAEAADIQILSQKDAISLFAS